MVTTWAPSRRERARILFALGITAPTLACADPLAIERAELVEHLARLEDIPKELRLNAYRVVEVEMIVSDLRAQTGSYAEQLRAMEGCGPCAEKLNASLESAHPCVYLGDGPSRPKAMAPPSKWDSLAELQQRRGAWEGYRAGLEAWARQKASCELALEDGVLGLRMLVGKVPDPVCADCRARLEAAGLLEE
ncbi:MAG: hypothetical protein ABIO70_07230 [Pseudomonadota bacterium]